MKSAARRFSRALAALSPLLLATLLFAGCSGSAQHQVVSAVGECSSCHSEEKPLFEWGVSVPEDTVESASSVTVSADADEVVVCVPRFTVEDGSRYVPVEAARAALDGGTATFELEEGLWAICVEEGDTARARLVHVDPSRADAASIEL